jgi:hypothetical protein
LELRSTLKTQDIRTIPNEFNISNYDINKGGFSIKLYGGRQQLEANIKTMTTKMTDPSVNGFKIPNLKFTTTMSNYYGEIFIPVPEDVAIKIEGNGTISVRFQLAFDTYALKKVFLVDTKTNDVYVEYNYWDE